MEGKDPHTVHDQPAEDTSDTGQPETAATDDIRGTSAVDPSPAA